MKNITCKFGGTSLADAAAIRKVIEIVRSKPERRFIVPSAPGKRTKDDIKVTDLLYTWHSLARQGLSVDQPANLIAARFREIAENFGVTFDIDRHIETMRQEGKKHEAPDYLASRGEYLNGLLVAQLLNAKFVEPAECIKFTEIGEFDPRSYDLLADKLDGPGLFVVPGFYGSLPDGEIKTFSRGGSDITGSVVARASGSTLYENWTDVSGFRMADPRIVPDAKRIDVVTYKELRELAYMGAQVLHEDAIFPVREPGIPINIRNTGEPDNPGTLIVAKRETANNPNHPVVGIAGSTGFTMINIEKALMNRERGFGRRVLQILEEHGINFEHMPTGIDSISLIVKKQELGNQGAVIKKQIERTCEPDRVTLQTNLSLLATVGEGMIHHVGIAARLCAALAKASVNIRVINQGASEINIIIGVEDDDFAAAMTAIHQEFKD
jgi:aspartate kinase